MSKSRFNVTLRDSQADGLPIDAIPQEGCETMDIEDHQFINIRQAIFLKRKSTL